DQSEWADVILCIPDGSRFYAHRLILANKSDVFRSRLRADSGEKMSKISKEDVKGESLRLFLKFLYTAEVSDKDMQGNYKDLLKLSHTYQ
ncbi:hypothetical protein KI387_034469, partial [Taxus chinensis]